jgi:hypothetical protein
LRYSIRALAAVRLNNPTLDIPTIIQRHALHTNNN